MAVDSDRLHSDILELLGRALTIRHVDAGSCNGCELEIHATNNPYYNLEGMGIRFVASPRHADMLLVTGPVWESSSATATVTVSSAAGVTVRLSSSNTSAARVPATVVVPAGATSASFPVTTYAVRRNTAVTIKASANGTTLGTTVTVLNR